MDEDPISNRPLSLAFWCAAVPFGLGCWIFLLWSVRSWEWLMMAGLLNLLLGVALFLVGSGFLLFYFVGVFRQRPVARNRISAGVVVGVLLALNFPACMAIISTVGRLETARWNEDESRLSSVRIVNASDADLKSIKLRGVDYHMSIKPSDGNSMFFPPEPGAEIAISMSHDGKSLAATIQSPKEGFGTVDVVFVVDASGKLTTTSLFPRGSWMDD